MKQTRLTLRGPPHKTGPDQITSIKGPNAACKEAYPPRYDRGGAGSPLIAKIGALSVFSSADGAVRVSRASQAHCGICGRYGALVFWGGNDCRRLCR